MDKKIKKCSNKKHLEIDAISYCQECKIYLCNTCQDLHLGLFEDHHLFNLDKEDINELFSDKCQIENHHEKCEYFCKNHNQLCCVACISKIKDELHGQHRDCNVCLLKDIENEKKNQLNENIKILEDLSNIIENKINEIKILYEKVNNNKEELKTQIQNIFTKIRNVLNEREDELLLYIDTKFNQLFINEELVKESEKLPNKIQNSLEKSRLIEKEWNNNNKLNILINNCINIENNIKEINILSQNINKCNINKNILFQISKTEDEINYCL